MSWRAWMATEVRGEQPRDAPTTVSRRCCALGLYLDDEEREKFGSATAMLSWWFATRGHFESPPAIDPAAEVIQGLRVDRTDRAWWSHAVRQALQETARRMGSSSGVLLLWLHLRPRAVVGYKRKKGVRVAIWADPVPLWDLYVDPTVKAYRLGGQRRVVSRYWEALRVVEQVAVERGWLTRRTRQ